MLRAATWKNLVNSKPDESYEDINDVQAIKHAQDFMGDYKLKTSHDYVLPEDEQVGVDGKWDQLKNLEKSIFELQEGFNVKIHDLKKKKQLIADGEQAANLKIKMYNKYLAEHGEAQFSYFQSIELNVNCLIDFNNLKKENEHEYGYIKAIETSNQFNPEIFPTKALPEKTKDVSQKCAIIQYRANHLIEVIFISLIFLPSSRSHFFEKNSMLIYRHFTLIELDLSAVNI